jgi:serine/threonine protein kinase
VYRDLKPENLMLSRNGYVKVADFGLAKKTLRTFTVCGTPDYMAPEVILSRGHGMPVDWWALGVLLYEMVTAITPFFGNEAMDIYENVLAHETVDDLEFPDDVPFSAEGKDLVKQLVHPKKNKRLGIKYPGVKGVKEHPFFAKHKFDWDLLAKVKMAPPLMPTVVDMSKYTTGNITYDAKINNVPDDTSSWQLTF